MRIKTRYIKLIVSLAFLVLLFKLVRKNDFLAMFHQFNPFFFVLSLLLIPVMIMTSSLKWKVVLDLQGTPVGFWRLVKIYFIGYYFSNILPSNVGGDIIRSYYAGRQINSQSYAAVSVFVERITGLLILLLLVIVLPLFGGSLYSHPAVIVPASIALCLVVVFFWLFRYTRPVTAFFAIWLKILTIGRNIAGTNRIICRFLDALIRSGESLHKMADGFHDKLQAAAICLKKDWKTMIWVVALTIIHYAMAWVNVYLAFRTFGVTPPFWGIVVILPTSMMVAMIPITLGSLGIAEGSYVFYFGLIGIDKAATLVMGLFLRFKMILAGLVGLTLYLTHGTDKINNVEQLRDSGS
ncbi:MAG: lysylphosphatidylglycerol synthase transmembrane domain-containing protein [Kiritimatiellae bacterium]|nr:lysylphosphatidylglycerol synthase transmembrane domain-containing protein [Kiritimatiellia bacterium]MDD5522656.1 lysylphosphatidylglycerol synthase transmembrane domain-containing protein [Kiritimatiellia bacterium]